jgi:hypothetical protein
MEIICMGIHTVYNITSFSDKMPSLKNIAEEFIYDVP